MNSPYYGRDAYEKTIVRRLTGVGPSKAFVYQIEDQEGKVVYIGVTNSLRARAAEHLVNGTAKLGEVVRKIAGPMPRNAALRRETAELKAYIRRNGCPPERNKTQDGKYHG